MTRLKAFLSHFTLSLVVVSFVLAIVLLLWYPQPFFQIIGARDALSILIGVDLVLGPLLTLVLFKPGKRGLMFDMACVALLQVSALVYGVSVLYEERPYFAVFTVDRFEILARKDVETAELELANLPKKTWTKPIFAVATMPTDPAERSRIVEEVIFEGARDIQYRPEFWQSYDVAAGEVLKRVKPLSELLKNNPDKEKSVRSMMEKYPNVQELVYVPVVGKKQPFALIIDKQTRMPLDIIDVYPWKKRQQVANQ